MDIVIAILGIYLLYVAFKMKKTKKIDRFVVAEEVLRVCKDEEGFAEYLSKKMFIFAGVLTLTGILMAVHEAVYDLGYLLYVIVAIAVGVFLWFYKSLTDGKNKYC